SAWCQLNVLAVRTAARATLSPYTTLFRSRPNRASLSNCTPLLYNNLWFLKKVVEPPKGSRISAQVEVVYIAGLLQIILPFEFERSEEHTSELQSREKLVCRLLLEKKNNSR